MVRKSNAHIKAAHRAEVARTKRLEAEVHAEHGDHPRATAAARIADAAAELAAAWAREDPQHAGAAGMARQAHEDALAAWAAVRELEPTAGPSTV